MNEESIHRKNFQQQYGKKKYFSELKALYTRGTTTLYPFTELKEFTNTTTII